MSRCIPFRASLALAGLLALAGGQAQAVMPPHAEALAAQERLAKAAKERAQSTDVLKLEIGDVNRLGTEGNDCPTTERWEVRATVKEALKGQKKAGDPVVLRYERAIWRCPGPIREELPALASGQALEAYLYCEGVRCVPSSGGLSFTSDEAFQLEAQRRADEVKRWAPQVHVVTPPRVPPELEEFSQVNFLRDRTRLTEDGQQRLQLHADFMIHHPDLTLKVTGYTRYRHSREAAMALGQRYAQAAKDYLVSRGVAAHRIDVVSGGRIERRATNPACNQGGPCVQVSYP
jgi:outer membrane protein OmpA-like peptidoglycan-associated protein